VRVSASSVIAAPPQRVYTILADYHQHHPRVVPPQYFRKMEVLEGGIGAGTHTRIEMRVLGVTKTFEHVVSEPEPGRVLVETDTDGSTVTTFTVEPAGEGATHLTIATDLKTRGGIGGVIERFMSSLVLPAIYRAELARIADYVRTP
jgi:uncharacterized protein YndB with AHSA1/START domain